MANQKKAKIEATKNGPLMATDISCFKTSKEETVKTSSPMALCRCGGSKRKPFCDGTHFKIGFNSDKLAGRQPDRVDDYQGTEITIHDNRGVCSHAGYCTDNLASVFRMRQEPWIDPNGAKVEEIIRVVRMCPSGALSFTINGKKHDSLERESSIKLSKDGPYKVAGGISLIDSAGSNPQSSEHYTLCRCGGSKNKPFCDGTHWYIKFKDEETDIPLE